MAIPNEIYHETNKDLRIKALAEGKWQAQKRRTGKQQEGWLNIGRPGDMSHAFRHIYADNIENELPDYYNAKDYPPLA